MTGPAVPSGLEALLAQATPGPWRVEGQPSRAAVYGRVIEGTARTLVTEIDLSYDVPFDRRECESDARLIALAPDAVRLLIDMADHLAATRNWVIANMGNPDDMDALLARFAALEQRAGTA